jgi:HSP20 family molecular chaperone IbpA
MGSFVHSKLFVALISFAAGSGLTYFINDYLTLKEKVVTQVQTEVPSFKNPAKPQEPEKKKSPKLKIPKLADPFSQMDKQMEEMMKRMDRAFGRVGGGMFGHFDDMQMAAANDIKITEHEEQGFKYIDIEADGIDKENLNIEIDNGMISVSGQIKKSSKGNGSHSEYISTFQRSFNVPEDVDSSRVEFVPIDKGISLKFPFKATI